MCLWEIYQCVKSKPTHYKRSHITYRAIYNMLYILRKLELIRGLSNAETERRGLKLIVNENKRIKPRLQQSLL